MFHIVIFLIVALAVKLAGGKLAVAAFIAAPKTAHVGTSKINQAPNGHRARPGLDRIGMDQLCLRLREKPPNIPNPAVTSASAKGSEIMLMRMVRSMSLLAC